MAEEMKENLGRSGNKKVIKNAVEGMREQQKKLGSIFPSGLGDLAANLNLIPSLRLSEENLSSAFQVDRLQREHFLEQIEKQNSEKAKREREKHHAQLESVALLEEQTNIVKELLHQQVQTQEAINTLISYTTDRDLKQGKLERLTAWVSIATLIVAIASVILTFSSKPPEVNVNPQINLSELKPILNDLKTIGLKANKRLDFIEKKFIPFSNGSKTKKH